MRTLSIPVIIKLLFLAVLSAFSFACTKDITGGYEVKDGTVIFHQGMRGLSKKSFLVEGADANTFEALDRFYGRDESQAYYNGKVISGSDGRSFKIIETPYTSDNHNVYYSGKAISDNPDGFKILFKMRMNKLENTFSTDGEIVFKGSNPFFPDRVDLATFEQVGKANYLKDKRSVYTLNRVIEEADPETFEVVTRYSERYSKDASNIFYNGIRVKGVDKETHEIIDEVHHRDRSNIFFAMNPLSEDPGNFQVISRAYSRDSQSAYWRGRKISDDAENFEVFPSDRAEAYAKDSIKAFWGWKTIEGADAETFVGLNRHYAKDKSKVYFGINVVNNVRVIEGADPETFALVKGEEGVDARDVNRPYYFGHIARSRN